jgi:cell division septation protein DedD
MWFHFHDSFISQLQIFSIFVKTVIKPANLDILHHIKDILLSREGLVIPNLGSIVVHYLPAETDPKNNKVLPPRRSYSFNPTAKEDNEHILINSIASKENIPVDEASERVGNFVEEIKKLLEGRGQYHLEGIGTLYKESGKLEFQETNSLRESSLGMDTLEAEPFELAKPESPTKQETKKIPGKKKTKGRKIKMVAAISGALLLLLFIVAGIYSGFFEYYINKYSKNKTIAQQEQKIQETPAAKDTISNENKRKERLEKTLNKMTDKKRALMYKEPEETEQNTQYHIVAGSFKRRSNAEEFRKELAVDGHSSTILEKDGLFRVSIRSFHTKEKALVSLYHLRDSSRFKSVWLLALQKDQ